MNLDSRAGNRRTLILCLIIFTVLGLIASIIVSYIETEYPSEGPPPIVRLLREHGNELEFDQSSWQEPLRRDQEVDVLRIDKVVDLKPFDMRRRTLTKLQWLHLCDVQTNDIDLTPLSGLDHVRVLSLNGTKRIDLSPLSGMRGLVHLQLFNLPINNLSAVGNVSRLEALTLDVLPRFQSDTDTFDTDSIREYFSGISGCSNLETLELRVALFSIENLPSFVSLTKLDLRVNRLLVDLRTIDRFSNLRHLYLDETKVFDLSPLAGHPLLETLSLSETYVSDLLPLATLPKLNKLDISQTDVVDISPLLGISSLQKLTLSKVEGHELEMIGRMRSLTNITMYDSSVDDLSPLEALPNLEVIEIGRSFPHEELARFRQVRPNVRIEYVYEYNF